MALYNFTGANGDGLPQGLSLISGGGVEIDNNALTLVTFVSGGTIVTESSGNADGFVTSTFVPGNYGNGSTTLFSGTVARATDDKNYIGTIIDRSGTLYLATFIGGVRTNVVSYAIPSYSSATPYEILTVFEGSEFSVTLNGVPVANMTGVTITHNQTATQHGVVIGDGTVTADDLNIGPLSELPATVTITVLEGDKSVTLGTNYTPYTVSASADVEVIERIGFNGATPTESGEVNPNIAGVYVHTWDAPGATQVTRTTTVQDHVIQYPNKVIETFDTDGVIPAGFTVQEGVAEVSNGSIRAASGSIIVTYDADSTDAMITAYVTSGTSRVIGISARYGGNESQHLFHIRDNGEVIATRRYSGYERMAEGYFIPGYNPEVEYKLQVRTIGRTINMLVNDKVIYSIINNFYLDNLKVGLLIDSGTGAISRFEVDDPDIINLKPKIALEGASSKVIFVNDPIPEFPYSVIDDIDGDITSTAQETGDTFTSDASQTLTRVITAVDSQGNAADPVTLTLRVITLEELTYINEFFTHPQYGFETYTTPEGLELTRFDDPQSDSFIYGITNPVTFSVENIVAASNNTLELQRVGELRVTNGLMGICDSTRIKIKVRFGTPVENGKLSFAFHTLKNINIKDRMTKNFSGYSAELEFDVVPVDDETLRIRWVNTERMADGYMGGSPDDAYYTVALSGNMIMPIFVQYSDATGTTSVANVKATATVGPTQYNVDGFFRNGKNNYMDIPFAKDDPFNKLLPDNVDEGKYISTGEAGSALAGQVITRSGDQWVDVKTVAGAEIGDYAVIGKASVVDGEPGSYDIEQTVATLGRMQRVIEIDTVGNRLRLSYPCVADFTGAGEDFGAVECLILADALTLSWRIPAGISNNRYGLVTGMQAADIQVTRFTGEHTIHYCKATDPIERFYVDYHVIINNLIFDYHYETQQFGEVMRGGYVNMFIPESFTGFSSSTGNADKNHIFVMPDRLHIVHMYLTKADRNTNGYYSCSRMSVHRLDSYSNYNLTHRHSLRNIGSSHSFRASGIAGLAGVIRKKEIDYFDYSSTTEAHIDAQLDLAENTIKHAICVYVASSQLQATKYSPTRDGSSIGFAGFTHASFATHIPIVNGGSGYVQGQLLSIRDTADITNTLTDTTYTVTGVDANGAVTQLHTTHTGLHKLSLGSATYSDFVNTGSGTGLVVDTSELFVLSGDSNSLIACVYPAGVSDSGFRKYGGTLPMGSFGRVRSSFDVRADCKAGMLAAIAETGDYDSHYTFEQAAVLFAAQKYGVVAMDTAGGTFKPVYESSILRDLELRERMTDNEGYRQRFTRKFIELISPIRNYTPITGRTEAENVPVLEVCGDEVALEDTNWVDPLAYSDSIIFGDITSRVTGGAVDYDNLTSSQTIQYNVTDPSGVVAPSVSRVLTLTPPDEVAPVINLVGGIFYNVAFGEDYTELGATVIDTTPDIEVEITGTLDPQLFDVPQFKYYFASDGTNDANAVRVVVFSSFADKSNLDIQVPDIPDGVLSTVLFDSAKNVIFSGDLEFVNGVATAEQLPVKSGELIRGTVDSGDTVDSPGTGVKGVTYAV